MTRAVLVFLLLSAVAAAACSGERTDATSSAVSEPLAQIASAPEPAPPTDPQTQADTVSDEEALALLGDPGPPTPATPIAKIYAAYMANPNVAPRTAGLPLFAGVVETILPLKGNPAWAAYASFHGGQVVAYFKEDDWRLMSKPLRAGEQRRFVCLDVEVRMKILMLMYCDTADI